METAFYFKGIVLKVSDSIYYSKKSEVDKFNNTSIIEGNSFLYRDNFESSFHLALEQVKYELNPKDFDLSNISFPFALKFKSSDGLLPTPSRESLKLTTSTKEKIKNKLIEVIEELRPYQVDKYDSYVKWKNDSKDYIFFKIGETTIQVNLSLNNWCKTLGIDSFVICTDRLQTLLDAFNKIGMWEGNVFFFSRWQRGFNINPTKLVPDSMVNQVQNKSRRYKIILKDTDFDKEQSKYLRIFHTKDILVDPTQFTLWGKPCIQEDFVIIDGEEYLTYWDKGNDYEKSLWSKLLKKQPRSKWREILTILYEEWNKVESEFIKLSDLLGDKYQSYIKEKEEKRLRNLELSRELRKQRVKLVKDKSNIIVYIYDSRTSHRKRLPTQEIDHTYFKAKTILYMTKTEFFTANNSLIDQVLGITQKGRLIVLDDKYLNYVESFKEKYNVKSFKEYLFGRTVRRIVNNIHIAQTMGCYDKHYYYIDRINKTLYKEITDWHKYPLCHKHVYLIEKEIGSDDYCFKYCNAIANKVNSYRGFKLNSVDSYSFSKDDLINEIRLLSAQIRKLGAKPVYTHHVLRNVEYFEYYKRLNSTKNHLNKLDFDNFKLTINNTDDNTTDLLPE